MDWKDGWVDTPSTLMTTRAPAVLTNSPMKYLVESIFLSTQREGSFD